MNEVAASTDQWCLVNHAEGQQIMVPTSGVELIVGRSPDAGLRIQKPTVSKQHAVLAIRGQRLFVRDLTSTNGTYVNGILLAGEAELECGDLLQFAEEVYQVGWDEGRPPPQTMSTPALDAALAAIHFNKLIDQCAVMPFFQPIYDIALNRVISYEVLGRSSIAGLHSPAEMFQTASRFSMEAELSRLFRREGMRAARQLPVRTTIYLNTHPVELVDVGALNASMHWLREQHPDAWITLEIHEAAVANPGALREVRQFLQELNIGLAFDDFGAGQARLEDLVEASPDVLKFDLSLVREIHLAPPRKQKMLEQLVRLALDLGVTPLAEGVETLQDHEVCRQLGFRLGQGYHYGTPGPACNFATDYGGETQPRSLRLPGE
jgi:EAL domain-containing protein (putative c-di-GMP-specific phosphodiesterase class I)